MLVGILDDLIAITYSKRELASLTAYEQLLSTVSFVLQPPSSTPHTDTPTIAHYILYLHFHDFGITLTSYFYLVIFASLSAPATISA